uniref:Reverse transcriptase domain-containing protein n=1 Tax=Tanacetum cinerariifolium TaxID=118510 RepID=A0A6L2P1C6_TANCI|nr:hypothetical protein [Tanacetum cinerariifolium]
MPMKRKGITEFSAKSKQQYPWESILAEGQERSPKSKRSHGKKGGNPAVSDHLMEEIDLSFTPDYPMPSDIEKDDYDSERDILILEELLDNNSLSLLEKEYFHFDIPSSSRPPAKPPDGNSGILNVKVMGDISEHKVPMPRLMFNQPTLVPNQEKSPNLLSHLGHESF